MNKQKKQFIILLVVVAVAAIVLIGVKVYNAGQEEEQSAEEDAQTVTAYTVNSDDIISISYVYDDTVITLNKSDDGWVYADDESVNIDADQVESMIDNITAVTANDVISDAEDLSVYGFGDTESDVTVVTDDGTSELYFGIQNEFSGDYYMMTGESEKVYTIDSSVVTGFSMSVEDLTAEEETEEET